MFTEHGHPIKLSMSSAKNVVHDTSSCNRVLYEIKKPEKGYLNIYLFYIYTFQNSLVSNS